MLNNMEKNNVTKMLKDVGFKPGEQKPIITLMSKFTPVPYAEMLFEHTKFIYDKRQQFWRYDSLEGVWRLDATQYIRTELRKNLMGDEQQKKYYAEEVIAYIKDVSYKENFEFKKNPFLIAFKNKLFDLKKDKFVKFSPEYYITNKLNIEINGNKNCPVIDKFFTECLDKEHKEILYDLAAYTLFTDYPYQKLFFIYGPPSTGKTQYLGLLEKFLGKDNCCMIEPKNIQTDKHAMYKMWLKNANIVSDINYDEFDNVNQIKKLTGGDSVDIRPMYQTGFSEILYAKQIYSTNKLPAVKEKTMAWYRRLYLIEFSNIVSSKKRDPFLMGKLTEKNELQGFGYVCLQYLRKLYKNNFMFTYDMDESQIPQLYEELSNPILMFIDENCVEGRDGHLFKFEFEERLNNWLKLHHFPLMTKTQMNRYMREHYNESNKPAPSWSSGSYKNKVYRVWTGLDWKTKENTTHLTSLTTLTSKIKKYIYIRGVLKTPLNWLNRLNMTQKSFKSLENTDFMIIKDKKDVEFKIKKDQIYQLNDLGDNSDDIFKTLLEDNKIIEVVNSENQEDR